MLRQGMLGLVMLSASGAHAFNPLPSDTLCPAASLPVEVPQSTPQAQMPSALDMSFTAIMPQREPVTVTSPPASPTLANAPDEWHLLPARLQHVLAEHIADTWDLQVSYAKEVVDAACAATKVSAVDPLLILAVAARETAFRHVGNPGGSGNDPRRPYGIMQVFGKWHADKFTGNVVRETSMPENVVLGAKVLKEYLEKAKGDENKALLRYVGAKQGTGQWYSDKVLTYRDNFRALLKSLVPAKK